MVPLAVFISANRPSPGVVVGQTLTNTSGDYRSAVVRGTCRRLSGDEHAAALLRLCEVRVPGRAAEVPPLTGKELAEAISLELPIIDGSWTAKVRAVGALDILMHASEMAQGNHWQKVIGQQALKDLGIGEEVV